MDNKVQDTITMSEFFNLGGYFLLAGTYLQQDKTGIYSSKLEMILREFKPTTINWYETVLEIKKDEIIIITIINIISPNFLAKKLFEDYLGTEESYLIESLITPLSLEKPIFPGARFGYLKKIS